MIKFKCGTTQTYNTLRTKAQIISEWMTASGKIKRKAKRMGNQDINKAVWEWFVSARSKNLPRSGPGLNVAIKLGNATFKGLESFKLKHNIV